MTHRSPSPPPGFPSSSEPGPNRRGALRALALAMAGVSLAACSGSSGSEGTRTTTRAGAPRSTTTSAPRRGSDGCGTAPDVARHDPSARPGDVARTFTSGGEDRVYRLAVPRSYEPDEATPLIVNLHGSGSNALQASAYSDLPRRAAERGMITVAPEAIGGKWELAGKGVDADFLAGLTPRQRLAQLRVEVADQPHAGPRHRTAQCRVAL